MKETQLGRKLRLAKKLLEDSWEINLREKPMKLMRFERLSKIEEHNNYTRKKRMFNEDELKFLEDATRLDLLTVNAKVDQMVNEMIRLGKNLSDIKITQSRLQSIIEAIDEDKKSEEDEDKGCCGC